MLEKIKDALCEQFDVERDEITEDTYFSDLGADSIDLFEFVLGIEEEYKIEIPTDDLIKIESIKDVINYLNAHGIEE
ncbi:MAG: acyl carrier protein [Lachnospiraceae bacterium]|jgi:acyl carrier protein